MKIMVIIKAASNNSGDVNVVDDDVVVGDDSTILNDQYNPQDTTNITPPLCT